MLCQKCKIRPATTHIQSVVNGVKSEINLCSACAAEQGYGATAKNGLVDMLSSVFCDLNQNIGSLATAKCECCGATFSEIANSSKVGCSKCYTEFKNELLPYVKRVHGTTKHIGKKPNKAILVVSKQDDIARLREKLNELIKTENFEEAAKVRDEIKKAQEENANE